MKLLDKYWLHANKTFNKVFKIDENDFKTREGIIKDYRESMHKAVFYPCIIAAALPFCMVAYFILISFSNSLFIDVVVTVLILILVYSDGLRWFQGHIKELENYKGESTHEKIN